jgi:hypothetical protein
VIERIFEYNVSMQLGDCIPDEREQRSPMEMALDTFDAALTDLINTAETADLISWRTTSRWRRGNASNASATNSPWSTTG